LVLQSHISPSNSLNFALLPNRAINLHSRQSQIIPCHPEFQPLHFDYNIMPVCEKDTRRGTADPWETATMVSRWTDKTGTQLPPASRRSDSTSSHPVSSKYAMTRENMQAKELEDARRGSESGKRSSLTALKSQAVSRRDPSILSIPTSRLPSTVDLKPSRRSHSRRTPPRTRVESQKSTAIPWHDSTRPTPKPSELKNEGFLYAGSTENRDIFIKRSQRPKGDGFVEKDELYALSNRKYRK
jgi:hypothetical protein